MNDLNTLNVRWRRLLITLLAAAAVVAVVFGIHDWQLDRIADNLLGESRKLAAEGNGDRAKKMYAARLAIAASGPDAFEEYAELVLAEPTSPRNDSIAFELLEGAIAAGSQRKDTYSRALEIAMRLRKFYTAKQILARLQLERGHDAEMYALSGICEYETGAIEKAELSFRKALELNETNAEAWTGLIRLLMEENHDTPAAIKTAEEMIALLPAEGHSANAWLNMNLGNLEVAGKSFWAAAKAKPGFEEYAFDLAQFIARINPALTTETRPMFEFCLANLKQVESSQQYLINSLLGDVAQRLGKTVEALPYYRKCLHLKSDDVFAIGRITEILTESTDYDAALRTLKTLPRTKSVQLLKTVLEATIVTRQGDRQQAVRMLEEALAKSGDRQLKQKACILLMENLQSLEQHERAVEIGEQLMEHSENADQARVLLVKALVHAGRLDEMMKEMHMFLAPETYVPELIADIVDLTKHKGSEVALDRVLDESSNYRVAGTVPRLFRAFQAAKKSQIKQAVQQVARAAAKEPDSIVFWTALTYLRKQMTVDEELALARDESKPLGRIPSVGDIKQLPIQIEAARSALVKSPTDQEAAARLLRLCSYDDEYRPSLPDVAVRLVELNPDNADALHLLSCSLRSTRQYAKSLRYSVEAFALKQNPEYLLHAAYTQWLAHRVEYARAALVLAEKAGLTASRLNRLDQRLLKQLKDDPDMHEPKVNEFVQAGL